MLFVPVVSSTGKPLMPTSNQRANQLIKDYIAYGKNLDYINIFDAFLGSDGQPREDLFVADRLHPNAAGYDIRVQLTRLHLGPPTKAKAQ